MINETISLGADRGHGNLLGIQPAVTAVDYASVQACYTKFASYLETARLSGWISPNTVAVFPEYSAAWLVLADEKPPVFEARTLMQAMGTVILAHPASFTRQLLRPVNHFNVQASLFQMKAPVMAQAYIHVFARLAADYQVTLVGGSILLPEPQIVDGKIEISKKGPLQNVSAVFRPDGSLHPQLVRKCFPINEELPFVRPAQVAQLPVFETPAGRLGVLICADAWFPATYQRLKQMGIDLLAVPSFNMHPGAWEQLWQGYSGWPEAVDVDPADIGRLSEGQAWHKYALRGRIASSGGRAGVNVFLQSQLWDQGSDGVSLVVKGQEYQEATTRQAALLNLWL